MNRIENAGQVKTGYSVKSGTNSEEKSREWVRFCIYADKIQEKKPRMTKQKAETGEKKNKETQPEETKNREMKNRLMAGSPKKTKKQMK